MRLPAWTAGGALLHHHTSDRPPRMPNRPPTIAPPLPEFPADPTGKLASLPLRADVRNRGVPPGPGPADPGAEPGEGALGSYLRAVRAHLVLVIAIPLACGIAAIAWGPVRGATYAARAHMLVPPIPSDDPTFIGLPLVRDTGDPPRTLQ